MEGLQLYTSISPRFSGFYKPIEEARYVILGVPYDRTSTYRSGSRFGPSATREASLNIETYSLRSKVDLEEVPMCDIGDLHVVDDVEETLRRVEVVLRDLLKAAKIPVMIGGEHTTTLGAVRSMGKETAVLSLDAHADLREEYSGEKISHATVMRRVAEIVGAENILIVGLRALCREELEFIEKSRLSYLTTQQLRRLSTKAATRAVRTALSGFERIYVTVDMDVFDPAFAPGVGNPEADGLSPDQVLSIISGVCDERVAGLDVVEVAPNYDTGATAVLASKVLFEAICAVEASRPRKEK